MGVATDKSLIGLTTAVNNISTSGMSDTTGQEIVDKLDGIKNALTPTASGISFTNTGTDLTATNVQGLGIELNNKINGLIKSINISGTTSANGYLTVNIDVNHPIIAVDIYDANAQWYALPIITNSQAGSRYIIVKDAISNGRVTNTAVTGKLWYI